jgi:hypothetical protein
MAPPKVANPRASAKFYRENPEARAKKAVTDTKVNARPEQRAKRAELAVARRERGLMGKGGPDLSHTKTGTLVRENPSTNRARNRGLK